jgi:LysR family glycine cleavage system transcriptional activator
MPSRLPPLNALRAFEAAARHLSFTKAAEELHVTQAAVSHQIKVLEADLGARLFRRYTRRLELTREGQTLLPPVGDGFARLTAGVAAVRGLQDSGILTVSVTPAFGGRWLAGRLTRFWERHPDIDLRLHHTTALSDFAREEVDLAVRYGLGEWEGLESEYLLPVDLVPVCSPEFLASGKPLEKPEDLAHRTLLHWKDYSEWTQWLKTAGVEDVVVARRGQVVDDVPVLLDLACQGAGVALERSALVADDIAKGRLVQPFPISVELSFAYHVVYPPGQLARPKVKAFRDWLREEASKGPFAGARDQG